MRIAIAQVDPIVGDFDGNLAKIKSAYLKACGSGARILMTPELGLCGYPPHDLLERPEIFTRNQDAIEAAKKLTAGKTCALIVGAVALNPSSEGRKAQNVAIVLENGKEVFRQAKTLLPTYDVFDETRYFEPAAECHLWKCDGVSVALAVCEDLWGEDLRDGQKLYRHNPVDDYVKAKAELILSIAASPYEWKKRERREALHAAVAKRVGAPLVYVNQFGATDEILFDGASFAMSREGRLQGRLPVFESGYAEWDTESGKWISGNEEKTPDEIETLSRGLILGVREYFHRTGFKKAILGLSGGIDSAVVATIAVQALGAKNVRGIAMPSQYSSAHSLTDAEALATNLGIAYEVKPIKFSFAALSRELADGRGTLAPIALENLQARLRGMTLMTLANHESALVLTTGNKSELAMGYCTLYGDMVGALTPIGDVFKTRVYELARHLNKQFGSPIPENSLTKAPSAELKPGQKDEDTLPPYEILDALLEGYLEQLQSVEELEKTHGSKGAKGWVAQILSTVERAEYKRLQSALVLKISPKAFGIGRRFPVAKRWDYKH
jgi:NAD+ synthase (glutamine-hydrolysing)